MYNKQHRMLQDIPSIIKKELKTLSDQLFIQKKERVSDYGNMGHITAH